MKFGQHLKENQFQPWKNEYIQYDYLKQYLKSAQLSATGWTNNDEQYFLGFINQEFHKVKQFTLFKINQIAEDMKPERANDLIKFVQINTTGFQKIIKKHDKWITTTSLSQQPLADIVKQLDEFIVQLSLQQHWNTTRKYWVHPDNLKQVEAILLFNLPVKQDNEMTNTIYFDDSNTFSSYSDLLQQADLAKITRARWYGLASQNTNVHIEKKTYHESYFKNKGIYTKEGVQIPYPQVSHFLLTGSYLGPHREKAQEIYESTKKQRSTIRCVHYRKTYQENPHFRITLDTKITLIKEMGPDWKRNDVSDSNAFVDHLQQDDTYYYSFPFSVLEIKSSSANKPLPAWTTNDLLAHQLVYEVPFFSKYLHGASHFFADRIPMLPWWLKEMEKDIRKRPSYAVLSTHPSMAQVQQQPESRCVVIEPPALPDSFHINQTSSCTVVVVDEDPKISFYAEKFKKQLKATYATIHEPIKDQHHVSMTRWLYAKLTNKPHLLLLPPPPSDDVDEDEGEKKKKKKKRIEPKIHFANERTFINWLQFSGLLMAVSLGLINFGDSVSKGSGAFFIVMAVILACYAELRFQYRSWQIRFRDEQRFDDMIGPAVLCFVFIIALMINLGLRMNQPLPVDPSPFGYNTTTTTIDNSSSTTVPVVQVDKHGHVIPPEEEEQEA